MMKKKEMNRYQVIHHIAQTMLFVLFFCTACTDETCRENQDNSLRISICSQLSGKQSTFESLNITVQGKENSILSISLYGLGNEKDSAFFENKTGVNRMDIPLRIQRGESKFKLSYALKTNDTIADTFTIFHTNYPNFVSDYCSCLMFYHLDSVAHTKNLLNHYAFTNQNVTNEEEIHIEFFY